MESWKSEIVMLFSYYYICMIQGGDGRMTTMMMEKKSGGMSEGMCHLHASHAEQVISRENYTKWHVAAVALLLLFTYDLCE